MIEDTSSKTSEIKFINFSNKNSLKTFQEHKLSTKQFNSKNIRQISDSSISSSQKCQSMPFKMITSHKFHTKRASTPTCNCMFFPILIVALAAASVMNTHACQKGEKGFFFSYVFFSTASASSEAAEWVNRKKRRKRFSRKFEIHEHDKFFSFYSLYFVCFIRN